MSDEVWLAELYDRNRTMLRGIGRLFIGENPAQSAVIEDHIQEVFMILWKKRSALRNHSNIEGWLVEAMRKCLLAHFSQLKRRGKHLSFSLDDENASGDQIADTAPDVYSTLAAQEHRERLAVLLGQENADLFYLYSVEGYSAKDLAARYGISESCVWVRVGRIKKKILAHSELFLSVLAILLIGF